MTYAFRNVKLQTGFKKDRKKGSKVYEGKRREECG